jgi:hypothetical protein
MFGVFHHDGEQVGTFTGPWPNYRRVANACRVMEREGWDIATVSEGMLNKAGVRHARAGS